MDAFYIDPSDQDSRQCRSRANSHLSSTAAQLQGLNIGVSAPSSEPRGNLSDPHHTSSDTHPASSSTSPDHERHPSPISFISAPVPQQTIPFPLLSESDFDANWSYHLSEEGQTGTAPLVRLDSARPFLGSHPDQTSSHHDNLTAATMSTVGIQQFDPRFDAGIPGIRHTYTWPQFDMNQEFLSQNPSPGLGQDSLTPFDDPKLLPLYARSLSSSPPRGSLTPEQRELKRQRDHARRDSKTRIRRERSTSNPYVVSQKGSPDMLPRTVPEYTTSLTPSPLLSQESPSLGSTAYLTPYSPQIGTDSVPSDMYGPVFTMAPNDFTTIPAYNIPYSNAGEPSLQSFVTRPHSLSSASDHQPNIYQTQQVSPKMVASDSGDHVRVVHSRPKPQCWEHGCNGRQFSTFSNLLRHQREKSGAAAKSTCPNCGAEFTRTTARNGHMAHEKCKQRRNS